MSIFNKPILTKANCAYFIIAIIIGVILAIGVSPFTYHPAPLQVPEDQYQPFQHPAPAAPTLAPQFVPGSSVDAQKDVVPDKYAPAKPPVVVTTAPLPTITPTPQQPTPVQTYDYCTKDYCTKGSSAWNTTAFASVLLFLYLIAYYDMLHQSKISWIHLIYNKSNYILITDDNRYRD